MPKQMTGRKPETGEGRPGGSAFEALQVLFGDNLREARLKASLTQRDIEVRTGIKQAYVSQIECGRLNPTLATMAALAGVVGKDLCALLRPMLHPKVN
jgi:DNA-binding XRE family transcriptional regulator